MIIDTSTAHRTLAGWEYGFPEISDYVCEKIKKSKRIAVPGCHASWFIALTAVSYTHLDVYKRQIFDRCTDDSDYKVNISVKTKEGLNLILKEKNYYDDKSQTPVSYTHLICRFSRLPAKRNYLYIRRKRSG